MYGEKNDTRQENNHFPNGILDKKLYIGSIFIICKFTTAAQEHSSAGLCQGLLVEMSESPTIVFKHDPTSPQQRNASNLFGLFESPYSRLDTNSETSPLIAPFRNDQDDDQDDIQGFRNSSWDSFKRLFHTRIRYYIPVLAWAPKYSFDQVFKQDLIAGISVAFLIIPQVLIFF